MAFKPMDEREFRRLIKIVGWSLKKSGFDYSLLNERDEYYVFYQNYTRKKHEKRGSNSSLREKNRTNI